MSGYRKGERVSQGKTVPSIDFDSTEERDRALRVLEAVDHLGGESALATLTSERSGEANLEEVTKKMRELKEKLVAAKKDEGDS